jgi:hypothetical protein
MATSETAARADRPLARVGSTPASSYLTPRATVCSRRRTGRGRQEQRRPQHDVDSAAAVADRFVWPQQRLGRVVEAQAPESHDARRCG